MKTHFTELSIVTAVECLNEVYYDEIICNIFISNLNLIDQHGIQISNALKEKLSNFVSNYLKNFNIFVDLENEDFCQILSLVTLLLEFQDLPGRCKTAESILPLLLTSCSKIVHSVNTQSGNELEKLIKYFRIIETLLKSISKLERNSKIHCVLITLEDLLSKAFLVRNESILVYSFSLLFAYYQVVPETKLIHKIWSQAVDNLLKDRSYSKFYLIMVTYLITCSFSKKELYEITNTDEFWIALQICLEDEQNTQKHALHILKHAAFNLCEHQSCKSNHSKVFDCAHSKEYSSWWKTYFVVMENLNEKQTHLVLPTFSLVNNLMKDEIVKADLFWILKLLQNALKHDSRTVRIEALLFLLNVNVSDFNKRHIRYIVRIMLTALNDSSLFRKSFKLNKFHDLKENFIKFMTTFGPEYFKVFFETFYKMFIQLKWSPIPLFYALKFLTQGQSFECLDCELVRSSNDVILSITRFHNVIIRAAVQSLFIELLLMYSEKNPDTAFEVLTLINNFNGDECILRNVTSWKLIIEYLRQSTTRQYYESYLNNRIARAIDNDELSDTAACFFARVVILFDDAVSPENVVIKSWMSSFENVLHKPYLNKNVQNNRLKFIIHLLTIEQSCMGTRYEGREPSMRFRDLSEIHYMHFYTYIIRSLMDCEHFQKMEFYENALTKFSELFYDNARSLMNISTLQEWLVNSCRGLNSDLSHLRYSSLKIISWICSLIRQYPKLHCNVNKWKKMVSVCIANYINNFKEKSLNVDEVNTEIIATGKLYSKFTNNLWSTMELYFQFEMEHVFENVQISVLFDMILDALDLARKENLCYILKSVKTLFSMEPILKHETMILNIMNISWRLVEETSTTPFYTDSLRCWIQAFYQEKLLKKKEYQIELIYYVNKLLKKIAEDGGQSYYSMILVVKELSEIPNLFHSFPDVFGVLINIFSITHINRKDQRIENETIEYIRELGDNVSVNRIIKFDTVDSAEEMRLMSLNILLKLNDEELNDEKWSEILKVLTSGDENKKRYFNDSAIHRIKHKRLQLLLIFETLLFSETSQLDKGRHCEKLFYFAVDSLLTEPHQPSVRYMLEWLLVRLINHFTHSLESKFWKCFSEASEERIGSICSFISIAFHLANISRSAAIIDAAIKSVLPWTMAQHFNARLYSQTVLTKLLNIHGNTAENYEIVRSSLENSLKTGNAVKNAIKLQNDFYFSYFHPMEHFSLETILWDLPRLSNICREEWIKVDLYDKFITSKCTNIPVKNDNAEFANFTSSSWIAKATAATNDEIYHIEEKVSPSIQESQKKFIPQTDLLTWASVTESKKDDNFIVVASLIDRAPNLGGLTRTCEIFAVSALIVNGLEVTKNKEFTSLSITAEKHVQISEVKRYHLFTYLKKKKEEGYCIIGAEQTTNSKNLSQFSFPKKSVLVLGNEKEGIPADLLCLLDVCVEIPQKGVIRSLNVHVSASLFIWEYAKQHVFGN